MKSALLRVVACAILVGCGGGGGASSGGDVPGAAPAGGGGIVVGKPVPSAPAAPTPAPSTPETPPGAPPVSQPSPGQPPAPQPVGAPAPILFVTQTPLTGGDFARIASTFGHHVPSTQNAPRGGDLWIAYPTAGGTGPSQLRNLTREAGFGTVNGLPNGQITTNPSSAFMVAVRDPAVHWSGAKALVSMVVGSAPEARWQIYEVTGLEQNASVKFARVNQPSNYNNVSAVYGSQEQIIFTSDMPRGGPSAAEAHLYPLLDEYEEFPTVTGVWELKPASGMTRLLYHAPSGSFRPIVDSSGRIVFTNWDHLQRDQQAGSTATPVFNYLDESANAATESLGSPGRQIHEVFPEPRFNAPQGLTDHAFNVFFPWMLNQDGTGAETLNHVGRQEFGNFSPRSRTNAGLSDLNGATGPNASLTHQGIKLDSFHFLREDPLLPGSFYAVRAPEFGTHGGGGIVRLNAGPSVRPQDLRVSLVTPSSTMNAGGAALYRSPLPTGDARLLATVSTQTAQVTSGSGVVYNYRLRWLDPQGTTMVPGANFTSGIQRNLNGQTITMWEWDAVEVRARPKPPETRMESVESPEAQVFSEAGVPIGEFQDFMRRNDLALIVTRNVTSRDEADRQQPFNLKVRNSNVQSARANSTATLFNVDHLQLFTAQQLRGVSSRPGRRVLAQPMKQVSVNGKSVNPAAGEAAPEGSVRVSTEDGSAAALVPARRAMTWQLVDSAAPGDPLTGTDGIVRERFWLTFQSGEVRVCASCHGVNNKDQAGRGFASINNPPKALRALLEHYKTHFR